MPRDVAYPVHQEAIVKTKAAWAMAFTLTGALAANPRAGGKVRVCVNAGASVSSFVLVRAEGIASRIFASAGVAMEWHSGAPAVCREPDGTKTVILGFAVNAPAQDHPGAMAYAQPYERVHIVVLFDRIEKSTGGPGQASTLLAHVMAHEITHLLQGISRHSPSGVLKAQWNAQDLLQMTSQPLPFTADDIDLIQLGLRVRAAGPLH